MTVKGIVRSGKIELIEELQAPDGTEVTVELPEVQKPQAGQIATFGMFADPTRPFSTEEDFKEARRSIWGDTDAE